MTAIRLGTVFVGELPKGGQWRLTVTPSGILATNPEHPPILFELLKPNFVIVETKEKSPWAIST